MIVSARRLQFALRPCTPPAPAAPLRSIYGTSLSQSCCCNHQGCCGCCTRIILATFVLPVAVVALPSLVVAAPLPISSLRTLHSLLVSWRLLLQRRACAIDVIIFIFMVAVAIVAASVVTAAASIALHAVVIVVTKSSSPFQINVAGNPRRTARIPSSISQLADQLSVALCL